MDERVSFFQLGDGAAAPAPSRVAAMTPRRPAAVAPKRAAAAAAKRGPVGRMQAGLATAFQNDPNSEEF
jgi:hypothetical protein